MYSRACAVRTTIKMTYIYARVYLSKVYRFINRDPETKPDFDIDSNIH